MSQHNGSTNIINLKNVISFFIVGLILFFLFRFLYENWQEVSAYDFQLNYYYILISFPLLFGFFIMRVYCWRLVLKKMGIILSIKKSVKISFLSMMGRYLPGRVWMVMGKVYLCGKEGVSKGDAFASVVMEIVLEIVASIFFFFFFLYAVMEKPLLSPEVIYSLAIVMIFGLVLLYPRVFYAMINFFLLRLKGEKIKECISYKDTIQLFFLYNFIVLLQGCAFYVFINSICYVSLDKILGLTGSLSIAGALGTLSFFTPSGLGVREGVLALLLSNFVAPPIAVIISLLTRLWVTLGEVFCALFAWRL
jgi:uncharacterized protein (TIRG00374 family)